MVDGSIQKGEFRKAKKDLYERFVDHQNAHDCILRSKLWEVFAEKEISGTSESY